LRAKKEGNVVPNLKRASS